jgi:MutS domain V
MKAHLMYRDRDFTLAGRPSRDATRGMGMTVDEAHERALLGELPSQAADLLQDLELRSLLAAMAGGDALLYQVSRKALLGSLTDVDAILYRQGALGDCFAQPAVVREMYAVAVDVMEQARKELGLSSWSSPEAALHRSLQAMKSFIVALRRLRSLADQNAAGFRSEAFTTFFAMIERELSDDYFREVEDRLEELRFKRGVLLSARLGRGNRGTGIVLRRQTHRRKGWLRQKLSGQPPSSYSFEIAERDIAGARALAAIRNSGVEQVADVMSRSARHILDFLGMLRLELAFYIACLNLSERLHERGLPIAVPVPHANGEPVLAFTGLYDVCLSLQTADTMVGNDLAADGGPVVITGANQGGKSTLLRGIGVAQLMLQCGMFVGATSFEADVRDALFTHFKREEDATMQHGKLDEELARMSSITERVSPASMLLCNESFASTNEREGSEIARQIVCALAGSGVKVLYVTHMYDLAASLAAMPGAVALRAERGKGGDRPFKLLPGDPQTTSYAEDSFRHVFGEPLPQVDLAPTRRSP